MREITRFVKVALKCLIAVVLVDVDLPYWTSKVEHLVAFPATVSNISTAHAQKRLCFPFIFAFYILNVRHISTSGLFDLLT